MTDGIIPDELSLTGSGLKEDLYVGSLFGGMNPGAIAKGLQHAKNLAAAVQSSLCGNQKISNAVQSMSDWLGPNAQVRTNRSGDKIFLSENGNRKIRFDLNNPSPYANSHGHVEEFVNGHWIKSGPIYPNDLPNK
jgi:hypothetical protein